MVGALTAAVVAAVVATAVVIPSHEAAASSAEGLDAHGATTRVRNFLTSAVVDGQSYDACQYLTSAQRAHVAALEGPSATCSDVLTSSAADLFGLRSNHGVEHLSLRATVRGRTADVTATERGQAPATFLLTPTTAGDFYTFASPPNAWRISSGATRLFGAPHATPSSSSRR